MIDIVIPTLMLIDSCPLKYSLQEACKSNLINQISNNFSEIISKDLFYYEQTKRR